jgi:hypothetical protein
MIIRSPSISDDILLHYVPLDRTFGISAAFSSGELLAIISHADKRNNLSTYANLKHAIWTHCPLSTEDEIQELWVVYHQNTNLRICALVVRGTNSIKLSDINIG